MLTLKQCIITIPLIIFFVGTDDLWPILLAFTGFPCLISLIILPFFPESPRYLLVTCDNETAAREGKLN